MVTLFDLGKTRKAALYVKVVSPRGDARIPATVQADATRHGGIPKVEGHAKSVESDNEALSDNLVLMLLGEAISSSMTRFLTIRDTGLEDDEITNLKSGMQCGTSGDSRSRLDNDE